MQHIPYTPLSPLSPSTVSSGCSPQAPSSLSPPSPKPISPASPYSSSQRIRATKSTYRVLMVAGCVAIAFLFVAAVTSALSQTGGERDDNSRKTIGTTVEDNDAETIDLRRVVTLSPADVRRLGLPARILPPPPPPQQPNERSSSSSAAGAHQSDGSSSLSDRNEYAKHNENAADKKDADDAMSNDKADDVTVPIYVAKDASGLLQDNEHDLKAVRRERMLAKVRQQRQQFEDAEGKMRDAAYAAGEGILGEEAREKAAARLEKLGRVGWGNILKGPRDDDEGDEIEKAKRERQLVKSADSLQKRLAALVGGHA